MKKVCVECQEEFQGRIDKKFCSDSCRSAYHNRLNGSVNNFVRSINNILRKNRRILAELNPEGKTTISRERLQELGFKFSYFTNEYQTRTGRIYKFCYDQGWIEQDNGYIMLVIRQEYVD